MPALGADMDEGTLNEWLVKPGDTVTRGQIVAVVETTKAAVEVECWHEGTVHELLVPVGATIAAGTTLATMLAPGEVALAPTAPQAAVQSPSASTAPTPARESPSQGRDRQAPHHRRWISPAARRLAASMEVDIEAVAGTGPQGAVTIADVEHAVATVHPVEAARSAVKDGATDRAAAMRTAIAAAMSRSKREIPHYYLVDEVLLDEPMRWLQGHNANRPVTERVLLAVLQLKAVALAAQRFPEFNGFWREGRFEPASGVHVGVAISLRGGGLVAPAIHDVCGQSLDELMTQLTDLVARARAGSLRSSEVSDPSITVTNLGDRGVDTVFGVIYPPQVALVGFGTPSPRVCAVDGGIRIATTVNTTLAADHRSSDGHRGALFLAAIGELLSQPERLEK